MNAAKAAARHWWNRRHAFTRAQLDVSNWPHPRPSRDPRILFVNVGLVWTSILQVMFGPAPSSVQNKAFDFPATIAFSILAIVSTSLVVYAAVVRSQYWSFVTEGIGCGGIVLVLSIYSWALVGSTQDWWTTNSAGWALMLCAGNAVRMLIIARRFW